MSGNTHYLSAQASLEYNLQIGDQYLLLRGQDGSGNNDPVKYMMDVPRGVYIREIHTTVQMDASTQYTPELLPYLWGVQFNMLDRGQNALYNDANGEIIDPVVNPFKQARFNPRQFFNSSNFHPNVCIPRSDKPVFGFQIAQISLNFDSAITASGDIRIRMLIFYELPC